MGSRHSDEQALSLSTWEHPNLQNELCDPPVVVEISDVQHASFTAPLNCRLEFGHFFLASQIGIRPNGNVSNLDRPTLKRGLVLRCRSLPSSEQRTQRHSIDHPAILQAHELEIAGFAELESVTRATEPGYVVRSADRFRNRH